MFEDDLTAPERKALAALPRESPPSDLLEERTVRLLKNRGLLNRPRGKVFLISLPRALMVAAAVVVLILGSFWAGRWSKAPSPENSLKVDQVPDWRWSAKEVQRTGTAYILALEALGQANQGDPRDLVQGREAALATLQAATDRVFSLAPEPAAEGKQGKNQQPQVIWF